MDQRRKHSHRPLRLLTRGRHPLVRGEGWLPFLAGSGLGNTTHSHTGFPGHLIHLRRLRAGSFRNQAWFLTAHFNSGWHEKAEGLCRNCLCATVETEVDSQYKLSYD